MNHTLQCNCTTVQVLAHVKDWEEDMVYLFQFTRSPQVVFWNSCFIQSDILTKLFEFQTPSISPFCLKLESWLKLHGIKYQVRLVIINQCAAVCSAAQLSSGCSTASASCTNLQHCRELVRSVRLNMQSSASYRSSL